MESLLPAIVVLLVCAGPDGRPEQCLPASDTGAAVESHDFIECQLRVRVSRRERSAGFNASCTRGARIESRGMMPVEHPQPGARVIASVSY